MTRPIRPSSARSAVSRLASDAQKIAAVLCAAAAFLTMSGCKKAPPGTLTGISISYSGMCYDDTYGFSIRNDPVDGCLFSCNYKDDEWVELENIPVEDTHWQEALALAEKLGLESLPDEKKNSPGLFITDETLDSVCLIYKAPDGEIIYRYLDADGNTRSTLRDFLKIWQGSCKPKEREVTHNGNAAYQLPMPCLYRSASL